MSFLGKALFSVLIVTNTYYWLYLDFHSCEQLTASPSQVKPGISETL